MSRCVLQVHRLVVVDSERRVVGILSLSDILSYLVLRPAEMFDPQQSSAATQRSPNRPLFALDEDPPPETCVTSLLQSLNPSKRAA